MEMISMVDHLLMFVQSATKENKTYIKNRNMKSKIYLTIFLLLLLIIGCSDNIKIKSWNSPITINLPKNQKLVNITWREYQPWVLTRKMRASEIAETYSFKEESIATFQTTDREYIIIETK